MSEPVNSRKIYLPKPYCVAGHKRSAKNSCWTLRPHQDGTERLTIRCRVCMSKNNRLRYRRRVKLAEDFDAHYAPADTSQTPAAR